ncbi:hypothetical protein, partial [Akkermansia sp.]|uniref:hypothetical protein n=1 Tax=Akkermansia sp. TaxID=1872421 RepID=UPI003AB3677E
HHLKHNSNSALISRGRKPPSLNLPVFYETSLHLSETGALHHWFGKPLLPANRDTTNNSLTSENEKRAVESQPSSTTHRCSRRADSAVNLTYLSF